MHKHGKKKILAVVDDLLFTVKISDAAKRAGLDVEFVKSEQDVHREGHSREAAADHSGSELQRGSAAEADLESEERRRDEADQRDRVFISRAR